MPSPAPGPQVFRLSRAAVRYWDARAAANKVVELCRVLTCELCAYCAHAPVETRDALRWVGAFPIATKNYLCPGGEKCARLAELQPLLSAVEAERLLASPCPPLHAITRLRAYVFRIHLTPPLGHLAPAQPPGSAQALEALLPFMLRGLTDLLAGLTGAFGAMERIAFTPLPFAYVAHLRSLLVLSLAIALLPVLAGSGLAALPALLFLAWALFGTEAAAVDCESPFHRKANHLAFGRFATVVALNVFYVAQTVRDMQAARAV